MKPHFPAYRFSRLMLPALLLCLGLWGCGGEEAPPEAGTPAVEDKSAAAPVAADKPAGPPVLEVLGLMPASTQVAVALPSIQQLLEGAVPLAKKVAPATVDIDAMIQQWTRDLGAEVGMPEAQSLNDIALALGVDPQGPMAIFADMTPFADEALKVAEQMQARKAAEATEAPAEPEAPEAAPDGTEPAAAPEEPEMPEFEVEMEAEPHIIAVLTIADPAKAQARIEEAVAKDESLDQVAEEIEAGGITIHSYDPEKFGYFFVENKVVMGQKLSLLQEAAARISDPQTFRYGSDELPVNGTGEIAAFVFGQRLLPLIERVQPAMASMEGMGQFSEAQLASMREMFQTTGEDDPWFYGMSWTDKSLLFTGRVDTATHPGMMKATGTPNPLRLALLLPESTLGFITIQLTPEMKQQFIDVYLGSTGAMGDQMVMASGMARQVLDLLKDELLIGVAGVPNEFPEIYIMATLANPESMRGMMGMFFPTTPGEMHRDVQIEEVASVPAPFPVSLIMMEDLLVVSNNSAGLKKIIDLRKDGQDSGYFTELTPPLDPKQPRYSAFVLDSRIISDFVLPLSRELMGGLGDETDATLATAGSVVDEIRAISELREGWAVSDIEITLKDSPTPIAPAATAETAETAVVPAS